MDDLVGAQGRGMVCGVPPEGAGLAWRLSQSQASPDSRAIHLGGGREAVAGGPGGSLPVHGHVW